MYGSKFIESNIDVYVEDYGTIDSNSTNTAAVNNGQIFQKAFNHVYKMRFSSDGAITCTIWCPPGDYYLGDSTKLNLADYYPINFNHPQAANIVVSSTVELDWANRPSNSNLSNASSVTNRYNLLSSFYQTRFHFSRNGISGRNLQFYDRAYSLNGSFNPVEGTKSGFRNIGFFGRYDGSPGTFNGSSNFYARGLIGSLRVEKCCFHGFGAITANPGFSYVTATDGWGIGNVGSGSIDAYDIQIVDCMRGLVAESGGAVRTFGNCSIIHNKESGIVAADNGIIYFAGEGSGYISNSSNFGAHAFSRGTIRFGYNSTHNILSSGSTSIRVDTKGLITGQSGTVSYSSSENVSGGDGMILFR
jgi:hypothetical protein